jgi:rod shape-determining protein MreC
MRNLFRFILRHHFLILFLCMESFSLYLLFQTNPYQKVRFYEASHQIYGRISLRLENLKDYFSLFYENRKLVEENTRLYNRLKTSYGRAVDTNEVTIDSIQQRKFLYINAQVINNSVSKQYNYITINKGTESGIGNDMAVINSEGIVGIVKSVSKNYAAVLSLLNRDFMISGKIKKNGYFGPMSWNGISTDYLTMVDIPHHVKISKGDTVITSGFGGVFPEGCIIGTIENFRLKGGNYYEINVKISNDFRKLNEVQVISNMDKIEIDSIENDAPK